MPDGDRLPRVQTKKEFHECLEGWVTPPKRESGEYRRGHPRELKSYVLETNSGCKRGGCKGGAKWSVSDTGVSKLKILRIDDGGGGREAFLDTTDDRFYVLHTNEKSETAAKIVDMLTDGRPHSFDRMWMHHGIFEAILKKAGNSLRGFGIVYSDELNRKAGDDGSDSTTKDLTLTINGSMAHAAEQALRNAECLGSAIAYNKLRIMRGEAGTSDCACDDVTNAGYFAMKHGRSILDHLDLVRISKDVYSGVVDGIEEYRLGSRQVNGKHIVRGKTLDFTFKNPIPDLPLFISRVFSTAKPFKLWGLESKLDDGYFDVLGIDLHSGGSMNFEVARDFMRVYLSEGSCGSTVLRLLTNLQLYYGRGVACERVDQLVRWQAHETCEQAHWPAYRGHRPALAARRYGMRGQSIEGQ